MQEDQAGNGKRKDKAFFQRTNARTCWAVGLMLSIMLAGCLNIFFESAVIIINDSGVDTVFEEVTIDGQIVRKRPDVEISSEKPDLSQPWEV